MAEKYVDFLWFWAIWSEFVNDLWVIYISQLRTWNELFCRVLYFRKVLNFCDFERSGTIVLTICGSCIYRNYILGTNFFVVFMYVFSLLFTCFLKRSRYIDGDLREKKGKTQNFQKRLFWAVYALEMSFDVFLWNCKKRVSKSVDEVAHNNTFRGCGAVQKEQSKV